MDEVIDLEEKPKFNWKKAAKIAGIAAGAVVAVVGLAAAGELVRLAKIGVAAEESL